MWRKEVYLRLAKMGRGDSRSNAHTASLNFLSFIEYYSIVFVATILGSRNSLLMLGLGETL